MAESLAVRRAARAVKSAREEADVSIRSRSEFLANMNHELRTPLNAIIGFSTMMRDEEAYNLPPEQRRSYAEYILQSADLLLAHINTILSIADIDAGSLMIESDAINAGAELKAAADRAAVAAVAAGVALEIKQGDAPAAEGDSRRFGQALDHILRAAIAASSKGGKVLARVGASPAGGCEIAVRDFGEGYDAATINRMLNVFGETHRGLDKSLSGARVGLAVAKCVIEMQNGAFSIESRPGKGAIVRVVLPPSQSSEEPGERRLAS
jgi:two-component system cell cycle sensor histidine kinase PleC